MSWLSLAIAILKALANAFDWARDRQLLDAGRDAEIAKVSASILAKTEFVKRKKEELDGLRGTDLDVLLQSFEPDSDGRVLSGVSKGDSGKG